MTLMTTNTPSSSSDTEFEVQALSVPRELSWLSFNERVLQEAADTSNPVIERVRFLGIFSNNMDEFFRVRVADVRRRILLQSYASDAQDDEQLMQDIQKKVRLLNRQFDRIYRDLKKDLTKKNIIILSSDKQLTKFQSQWLKNYYQESIRPHMAPLIVHPGMDLAACLNDDLFYMAVEMQRDSRIEHAVLEVPTESTSRFILLPGSDSNAGASKKFILLDDAIKHCLADVFEGVFEFDSIAAFSFKMTRDAEINLSGEIDQSIMDKLSKGLRSRLSAEPVRLVHDEAMPETLVKFLRNRLNLRSHDSLLPSGPYRNFKDFIAFPNVGDESLEHPALSIVPCCAFANADNVFDAIHAQDILLHYPYQSFDHFTEVLRQAAFDPKVTHIRINLYRVANNSRVLRSLCDAARNGKQVTAVVELHARFDEANNISEAKRLQSAGIRVSFGIPTLKVHAKLCLITRTEKNGPCHYGHIGSGNFHEKNARIYTDLSYFTCRPEITREIEQVFNFIDHSYRRYPFQHLIVSPINSRERLLQLIDRETEHAQAGKAAAITVKVNNLCDDEINLHLCNAAQAGVEIKLIVRGMCTLQTQVKDSSENIHIISIVDRFLEHSRVMIFHNQGDAEVFITSGDWMGRNIDNRVEVGVPIYDDAIKQRIIDLIEIQLNDNCKARIIDKNQTNPYTLNSNKRNQKTHRAQIATHEYLLQQEQG